MDAADAGAVPWGEPLESGRDRSLAARLERAIVGGNEELEPACPHLAAVRAWLAADGDRGDVREVLADVALLPEDEYETLRPDVAKAAGWRVSFLDTQRAELLRVTSTDSDTHQGAAPILEDVEPWPQPVDGAELLAELARTIARFVALPEGAATSVALWVLFAHAHIVAAVSPLLAITSPEKRCGKTTLLSVLARLVPRSLPASNISAAALFRAVEKYRPTLLVDEADTFLQDRDELRGVLNAGHTRATAYTVRCDGDDHDARMFSTWSPKVVAMIGQLPDTLADRAVLVSMRRRAPGENVERLRLDRLDELEPLLRRAARWALDNLEALRVADPEVPAGLHDRAADNWRPLLAIADRAGGDWPERGRRAAELMSGAHGDDDGSVRTLLLADLRAVMGAAERMASADIVEALVQMEHRPWPEWRRGNPLTARGMARLLEGFGARPRQLWIAGAKMRGYEAADLADAWARYLPDDAPPPDPPAPSGRTGRTRASTASPPNPQTVGTDNPTVCEIPGNPRQQGVLPVLPDGTPPAGAGEATDPEVEL